MSRACKPSAKPTAAPPDHRGDELVKLLSALRALIREEVREELRAARGDDAGDPVVPVYLRAKRPRRQAAEWCRDGRIPGAVKAGKVWCARASVIDAAIEAMGEPAKLATVAANDDAGADGVLVELGCEVVAPVKLRKVGGAK